MTGRNFMTDAVQAAPAAPAPTQTVATEPVKTDLAPTDVDKNKVVTQEEAAKAKLEEESKPKSSKKKYKYKVDGQDIEEEIDLDSEDEMKKRLQLAKAAQKRMAETADIKKQVDSFIKALKADPMDALTKLGIDVDGISEKHLEKRIKEMQLSPEEQEKNKMQEELERLRKEKDETQAESERIKMENLKDKFAAELDHDIDTALATSKMPKSPYVVKRIADTMSLALEQGYKNVKVSDVISIVEKQISEEISNMFGAMPEDVLEEVIGKQNLNRIRKNRIAKMAKTKTETAKQISTDVGSASLFPEKGKINQKDFFKNLK
jgi:hypothetical protein